MEQIPIKDFPAFTEELTIEEEVFTFFFNWNYRGQFWTLTILDQAQNTLVAGMLLEVQFEMLERFVDRDLPAGYIFPFDVTGVSTDILEKDLLNRISLVFLNEEEKEALNA